MTWLWIALGVSAFLNVVLLVVDARLANALQMTHEVIQKLQLSTTYWKHLAQQFQALVRSKETLKAAVDGLDFTLEHPDPTEQAEGNRIVTDIKRIADQLHTARAAQVKGSREPN